MEEKRIKNEIFELKNTQITEKYNEVSVSMNTLQSGEVNFITKPIKGFIECLIISTESNTSLGPVNIKVLMKNENICILDTDGFKGTEYIAPRISTMFSDYNISEYSTARWSINGPLHILVNGSKDIKIKFIIRYY